MRSNTYMKRENRDKAFNEIPREERSQYVKRSMSNQLMHPMYVDDWPYKLSKEDCGFGNTIYQTHFPVIYTIERRG